ncbi:MAG: hypothetical protein DI563_02355 [Variovorax paradoxus]|jgi:GntR family transcriptional regulator|uniref:HTH gntR-type domain-containing protein n=1 Tax=Variovorax paradoxus TaxID=34073 RepID=A0A2W5QNB7_VARPD|nr:MAG: hypothetical protein DI563_02355 [Variovorax paradoxus]
MVESTASSRAVLVPLDSSSAESLYAQLADRLAAAISSGVYGAGQQLPPEATLMKDYGISRVTVRQAIQLLSRNGQVVSRRGKGTFVTRASFQQDLSSLQGFQEALRLQGIEPETQLLEFSASAGRIDGQLPAGLNLPVHLRRRYCVDGEAFAVVEAFLPAEAEAVGTARAERLSVYDILQQFLGLRIGRADIAIQCAKPKNKITAELGLPPRSHVLLMQRTSYAVSGTPCEHMRIYIVPERYTFRMSVPGPMQLATAIQPATVS